MKKRKTILIFISFAIVLYISLTKDIIYTNEGNGVSLLLFESIYIYIIAILIALYKSYKNKKSNTAIIIALLTYVWTYYLTYQMIEYLINKIEILKSIYFYIYLSSSIFLIMSLFINNEETTSNQNNNIIPKNIKKENIIFTNFILGYKEIIFNSIVLLVNNTKEKTLDLIYETNKKTNTKKINLNNIKDISYISKARTATQNIKTEENATKSLLLSTFLFGGSAVHMLSNQAFNTFFDTMTNNYEKTNINLEYEITIKCVNNNEETKILLTTNNNPEDFINKIQNQIKENIN